MGRFNNKTRFITEEKSEKRKQKGNSIFHNFLSFTFPHLPHTRFTRKENDPAHLFPPLSPTKRGSNTRIVVMNALLSYFGIAKSEFCQESEYKRL